MTMPKNLEWHDAPELPPYTGEEIAVLCWCSKSCTFEVAQFNHDPRDGFLIGVDRWAMLMPPSQNQTTS